MSRAAVETLLLAAIASGCVKGTMTAERTAFVAVASVDVAALVGITSAAVACLHGPCVRGYRAGAWGLGLGAGAVTAGGLVSSGPEDPGVLDWVIVGIPVAIASTAAIIALVDRTPSEPGGSDTGVESARWLATFADPAAAATFARALSSCTTSAETLERHAASAKAEGIIARFEAFPGGEDPPKDAACGDPYVIADGRIAVWFYVSRARSGPRPR